MRKNLEKITARLHIGIARDEEQLERLRHGWDRTHEILEAAQAEADESRKLLEQLRIALQR
jgi:hypothetical protein